MDIYENSYHSYSVPSPTDDAIATTPEKQQMSNNVFDSLPCLTKPKPKLMHHELNAYLATDIEDIMDVLEWWIENCAMFLRLSRMAIDYLGIPGKSSIHSVLWY